MKVTHFVLLLVLVLAQEAWAQKKTKKKNKAQQHYLSATKTPAEIEALENKQERLFHSLVGHFSNREQADTTSNPLLRNVQELIAIPIWPERLGEYWFYMRWIPEGQPERPMAEVVAQLKKLNRDTFSLQYWSLPKDFLAAERPDEWKKPNPFAGCSVKKLNVVDGCRTRIYEKERNVFVSVTEANCSGADLGSGMIHEISLDAEYRPSQYNSFGVFFGKDGVKMFEYPAPAGLLMKRLDKNKPKY